MSWRLAAHRASILALLLVCVVACQSTDAPSPIPRLSDVVALTRLVQDTGKVIKALEGNEAFWERASETPLTPDERAWLLPLWATFIDQDLALLSFRERFGRGWMQHSGERDRARALTMSLAGHAAQTRARLIWLRRVAPLGAVRAALNEASPEYGVGVDNLDRVANALAHPDSLLRLDIGLEKLRGMRHRLTGTSTDLSDANALWQAVAKLQKLEQAQVDKLRADMQARIAAAEELAKTDGLLLALIDRVEELASEVSDHYDAMGGQLLKGVVSNIAGNEVNKVVSQLVTDIALWLGDTRVRASGRHLVSEGDLDALLPELKAGDVILERRNWYLSNLGLPGFWPHAALYLGTPKELAETFDAEASVQAVYPGGFTAYLESTYPEAWQAYSEVHEDGPMRIIEAVSEGVIFTSYYHSCLADYVAFLRPRLTTLEKANAIARSFQHWGKPYDFDFDFQTQSALVCSEVVWVSYQAPSSEGQSLNLTLANVMGRLTLPPNDIVKQYDQEAQTSAQQFDFVAFLDGREGTDSAVRASEQEFRLSWKRPKWDISQE